MTRRRRQRWSKELLEWSKKCHGVARRLFGTHKIVAADGIQSRAAYEYYIKCYIKERFGKNSRRELTEDEWREVYAWLRSLLEIRQHFVGLR